MVVILLPEVMSSPCFLDPNYTNNTWAEAKRTYAQNAFQELAAIYFPPYHTLTR
jgi:hypothetical protein